VSPRIRLPVSRLLFAYVALSTWVSTSPLWCQECAEGEIVLSDPALAAKLQEKLDSVSAPFAGTALAVSIVGVGTWRGAYGYSNWESQTPMVPDDRFRIASNTKTFVAAVILQLDQEGVLSIDDPIEKWVPGYFDGWGVTLAHLLRHTSGIFNYTDAFWANVQKTPEEIVSYASQQPALFPPGSTYRYSNTNYILQGMAIKAATGSEWYAEVRRRLLEPLGLADTYAEGFESLPGGYVRGYAPSGASYEDITSLVHYSIADAAGGMISNTRDLLRWLEALVSGEVLDEDHLEAMVTPFPSSVGDFSSNNLGGAGRWGYGLGLALEDIRLGPSFGHTGGLDAFTSIMAYFPQVGIGVVGWVNTRYDYSVDETFLPAGILAYEYCESIGCLLQDRNHNRILDTCDITTGTSRDCNLNGVPDESDLAPQAIAYSEARSWMTGGRSTLCIGSDLNGDGNLDLATMSRSGRSLSTLIHVGSAEFAPAVDVMLGVAPISLESVDLDGDHDLDLVTANGSANSLTPLRNDGRGRFATVGNLDLGQAASQVLGGDLNRDGRADLIATDASAGARMVVVLLTTGAFTFQPAAVDVGARLLSPLLFDVDRDGDLDLAAVNASTQAVLVLRNDGASGFTVSNEFAAGKTPNYLVGGDLDDDGDPDLVASNSGYYTLSILANDGSGVLSVASTLAAGLFFPNPVRLVDVDDDGDLDLSLPAGDQITLRLNEGQGSFPLARASQATIGKSVTSFVAGDFSGDGREDFAAVHNTSEVSIVLNETPPPESGDCNSNGIPDECDLASGVFSDTVPPVLTCPAHLTVFCGDDAGARVDVHVTAEDACHGEISVVRSPPLDFVFAPGTHTIISTATDASGNSSSCSFTVTVLCSRQLPGDCNQDAVLDLSDAVCVLGVLFTGIPPRFPCGDGMPGDPGNVALIDMQPDGAIDLSDGVRILQFLFGSGPPHPLSVPGDEIRGCVPIPGCPESPVCP